MTRRTWLMLYSAACVCIGVALLVGMAAAARAADHTGTATNHQGHSTSLTQYGITWTFGGWVRYGQYVTGDYWVKAIDADDPNVTVSAISPTPGYTDPNDPNTYRNGSMVNPATGYHAYDGRSGLFDPNLIASVPATIEPNSSLISTISYDTLTARPHVCGGNGHADCELQAAAVLTVVGAIPAATAFRPPFAGTAKPTYDSSACDPNGLASLTDANQTTYAVAYRTDPNLNVCLNYKRYFVRPWTGITAHDWQARYVNPLENMPDYYRETHTAESDALLLVNCNLPNRSDLMLTLVQQGIDHWGAFQNGDGSRELSWPLVAFAGHMLGSQLTLTDANSVSLSQQVDQTYTGTGWQGASVLWRQKTGVEHEDTDPNAWDTIETGAGCGCKLEAYRRQTAPGWVGEALAFRVMSATTVFDHADFFAYVDRWMDYGGAGDSGASLTAVEATCATDQTSGGSNPQCTTYTGGYDLDPGDCYSDWAKQMWALYRGSY